jgi:hypothetical protein
MNREELFDRHLRGELSAEEAAEFKRRLANEPETGRAFVRHVNETTLLVRVGSQLQPPSSHSKVVPLFPADGRDPRVPEFTVERGSGARGSRLSRMAKWAALAACVIALAAVAISLSRRPVAVATVPVRPLAEVYVTGERVQVTRGQTLLKGDAIGLQAGDVISTALHSATIAYEHESTRIEIQPGSVLVFGEAANGKRFELQRGIIRARVAAQPAGQPMRVKTTLARATVLGTEFVMRADEDTTKLDVLEGKVEFACRASGKKVKVKSGFSATLRADVPPSVVPLCSSNCILRECRGTNAVSDFGNFKNQK